MRPDEALNASSTSDIWKLHRDCKTCSFVVYKDFLVLKILFQLRRLRRPRFASSPPSSALPTASPVTASLAMMRSLVENDDVEVCVCVCVSVPVGGWDLGCIVCVYVFVCLKGSLGTDAPGSFS